MIFKLDRNTINSYTLSVNLYVAILQRLRIASNPSALWGPALQRFRNEAAEVHKLHGTTMGGKVLLPNTQKPSFRPQGNGNNVPERSVKYNPYPNQGQSNPGFDSPMS